MFVIGNVTSNGKKKKKKVRKERRTHGSLDERIAPPAERLTAGRPHLADRWSQAWDRLLWPSLLQLEGPRQPLA